MSTAVQPMNTGTQIFYGDLTLYLIFGRGQWECREGYQNYKNRAVSNQLTTSDGGGGGRLRRGSESVQ